MTRRTRLVLFVAAGAAVAALCLLAFLDMPTFGSTDHPYRNLAIPAAVAHATANAVSAVNLDQRGLDTFAEESILIASVIAVATLLRRADDEQFAEKGGGRVLDSTVLTGWIMLPVGLIVGVDVIAHGHLTPGGGFQGGIILGTAVHFVYVAGRFAILQRVRRVRTFEWGEAIGTGAYACVGIAGVLVAASFLGNVLPHGSFGTLFSSGTVALLNGAIGVGVASGTIVLVSRFVDQAVAIEPRSDAAQSGAAQSGAASPETTESEDPA
ncbi:MAG: MnhB domain-containing protein [Acidimicrobiales bacterium]